MDKKQVKDFLKPSKLKLLILLLFTFLLVGCGVPHKIEYDSESVSNIKQFYESEKSFYKKSLIGTEVIKLTNNPEEDNIFYQEPNYFSQDSSKYLFRSKRGDGEERLYLLDVDNGNIKLMRNNPELGWIPTWSKNGQEVYIGLHGEILVLNINTLAERKISVPENLWITFLHLSPNGERLVFIGEGHNSHKTLSTIHINGTGYKKLYELDLKNEFFLDHPIFVDDESILFLTRGENRDFTVDFNKPFLINLNGEIRRFPLECSHYDVNPIGNRILCGQEGIIIDLKGKILKEIPEVHGHGSWHPDGNQFLMTGDPIPVPKESPYFGKILLMKFDSDEIIPIVEHENSYDSSLEVHVQPNAQFSRDGKHIIYESEQGRLQNSDLYLVTLSE